MFELKKKLLFFYLALTILSTLVYHVEASTMNFTVHGGEDAVKPLSLAVEDRVMIKFTVLGGETGDMLNFYVSYPNGTIKVVYDDVGILNYQFVCDREGEYTLHFSNVNSAEDKLVSLDYEVQHYILGMPQMLFLTMVIVLICVAMVAVFILMGKRH
jgi:hypothetical protein